MNSSGKILLILLSIIMIVQCEGRNPDEVQTHDAGFLPTFDFIAVEIPDDLKQSQHAKAQQIVDILTQHNKIQKYTSYITIPYDSIANFKQQQVNIWTRIKHNENGVLEETKIISREVYPYYEWRITLNGFDSTINKRYDNWNYINAEAASDGDAFSLNVYDRKTEEQIVFHRMTSTSVTRSYSFYHYSDMSMTYSIRISGSSNRIYYYDNDENRYDIYWRTDGSGYWHTFNQYNRMIDSGDWE